MDSLTDQEVLNLVLDGRLEVEARLTEHGRKRACQRRLSQLQIAYVLRYGRVLWRTGVRFHFLAAKDLPWQHRHLPAITRLIGLTVVVGRGDLIITSYKNSAALGKIKKKSKFSYK